MTLFQRYTSDVLLFDRDTTTSLGDGNLQTLEQNFKRAADAYFLFRRTPQIFLMSKRQSLPDAHVKKWYTMKIIFNLIRKGRRVSTGKDGSFKILVCITIEIYLLVAFHMPLSYDAFHTTFFIRRFTYDAFIRRFHTMLFIRRF